METSIVELFRNLLKKYPWEQWKVERHVGNSDLFYLTHKNLDIRIGVYVNIIPFSFISSFDVCDQVNVVNAKINNCTVEQGRSIACLFKPAIDKFLTDEREARNREIKKDTDFFSQKLLSILNS